MQLTAPPTSKTLQRVGVVVSILPCLLLLMSAGMKLSHGPEIVEGFKHLGYPESLILPLGVVELLATLLYLVPQTAALGAVLLTGYIGGAVATHARLEEPVWTAVGLGVAVWLGLYLRDGRVRLLLPLRR
jgi:hypothetical protein